MSSVQEDVHHPAGLVATVCPLQLLLSSAGFRVELSGQQLGAISPSLQGPQPIAGPSNASPMGLPEADQSLVLGKGGTRSPGIANLFTAPTILAWDCAAASRILHLEAKSP